MGTVIPRRRFLIDVLGVMGVLIMPDSLLNDKKKENCFLYDDIYLTHDTGSFHPETSERLVSIRNRISGADWFKEITVLKAKEAELETISLVHDKGYIETVRRECEAGFMGLSTGDTVICKESFYVAKMAAGGVLAAVDAVVGGKAKNAFCAVRPPGHHASQYRGMGFCIFNNIAVAAKYAQKKYKLDKVLIADWDVHHGNGTQDVFYKDDTVYFMSTHQWPLYPGTGRSSETGEGKGKGFTMNRPFPAGSGNNEIIGAFRDDLLPAAKKFKPDLVLISAGFDSRVDDPLGGFNIDDEGFRELTRIMIEISKISGKGRLISILEGGYNLRGLASAVYAHMDELRKDLQ